MSKRRDIELKGTAIWLLMSEGMMGQMLTVLQDLGVEIPLDVVTSFRDLKDFAIAMGTYVGLDAGDRGHAFGAGAEFGSEMLEQAIERIAATAGDVDDAAPLDLNVN